jgi:transposase
VANDILSLSWYLASEGNALSNSDSWLEYYENPRGSSMSSQDVSRLLTTIDYDGMMTFYKLWLKEASKMSQPSDKVLYDLTSISYYGRGIDAAEYGYNRSRKSLPQVNYAFLCSRATAMPLFAWPLNGSIRDVSTLETTLQFLKKLEFKPDCLMLDRGFCSMDNITDMFSNKYTFLQAVKVNAKWIYEVIDASEHLRFDPHSKLDIGGRTYYASTSVCKWVRVKKLLKNGSSQEEIRVHMCRGSPREKYVPDDDNSEVIAQYSCRIHVLFCQDLVGKQHDIFMDKLKEEYDRLIHDEKATVKKEFEKCIKVHKNKYSRTRTIEFDTAMIAQHKNKYAGHICFLTNDKTIETALDALTEYSTRDYIEKDFDEMKNELDMERIRVHCDDRMKARLFLQFIAEIYMREIRVCLQNSETCKKLTRNQIFSHIRTINKVKFKGKYRDVYSPLSKKQKDILDALNVNQKG